MASNVQSYLKRFGIDAEKFRFGKGTDGNLPSGINEELVSALAKDTASSVARILAGSSSEVVDAYFPPEVIGGCCPRVVGDEEEIVWNAAAEACDSERVHVVWQSVDNKIWYLAVKSGELASHPKSWCPFAALLPGMKDAQPSPVCYTYYGDEMATMMTVTSDGMQIYRGTNMIVRAKAERTARALGDAQIVELVPDRITALTPVPWYSLSLFEDQARRILAMVAVGIALIFASVAFLIWLGASLSLITAHNDLTATLSRTQDKTQDMLNNAQNLRASPLREQLSTFVDLNDGLLDLNGFLEVYEIHGKVVRWRAVVPSNVTADRINALGGKTIEARADGTVIGNAAEIQYEAQKDKK